MEVFMNESKLKILKMLEEGKITFEQAQELLKATSETKESNKHGFWKNIFIDFLKEAKNFDDTKKIKDVFLLKETLSGDIKKLDFTATNGKISLTYSNDENVYISGEVESKVKKEKYIDYTVEKNKLIIKPIDSDIKGIDLEIQIPKRNYDLLKCHTSNDKIKLTELDIIEYDIETSNGGLILNKTIGTKINAVTSNDKIILKECNFKEADLQTSNGKINIVNPVIKGKNKFKTVTSNDDIDFEFDEKLLEKTGFDINTRTSNGNIEIRLPKISKKGSKEIIVESNSDFENVLTINAKTSNSDIFIGSK